MDKWLSTSLIVAVGLAWCITLVVGYFDPKYTVPSTVHFLMTMALGASLTQKVIGRHDGKPKVKPRPKVINRRPNKKKGGRGRGRRRSRGGGPVP